MIKGFVNNGDRVKHGATFCGASPHIVEKYGLHHIRDIEGAGTAQDIATVKAFLASQS